MLFKQVVILEGCSTVDAFNHFNMEFHCLISEEFTHLCDFSNSLVLVNHTNNWRPHVENALEGAELDALHALYSLAENLDTVLNPCHLLCLTTVLEDCKVGTFNQFDDGLLFEFAGIDCVE